MSFDTRGIPRTHSAFTLQFGGPITASEVIKDQNSISTFFASCDLYLRPFLSKTYTKAAASWSASVPNLEQ